MDEFSFPVAISVLADSIAAKVPDDAQLALLAAAFAQLGDTLATILSIRALNAARAAECEKKAEPGRPL